MSLMRSYLTDVNPRLLTVYQKYADGGVVNYPYTDMQTPAPEVRPAPKGEPGLLDALMQRLSELSLFSNAGASEYPAKTAVPVSAVPVPAVQAQASGAEATRPVAQAPGIGGITMAPGTAVAPPTDQASDGVVVPDPSVVMQNAFKTIQQLRNTPSTQAGIQGSQQVQGSTRHAVASVGAGSSAPTSLSSTADAIAKSYENLKDPDKFKAMMDNPYQNKANATLQETLDALKSQSEQKTALPPLGGLLSSLGAAFLSGNTKWDALSHVGDVLAGHNREVYGNEKADIARQNDLVNKMLQLQNQDAQNKSNMFSSWWSDLSKEQQKEVSQAYISTEANKTHLAAAQTSAGATIQASNIQAAAQKYAVDQATRSKDIEDAMKTVQLGTNPPALSNKLVVDAHTKLNTNKQVLDAIDRFKEMANTNPNLNTTDLSYQYPTLGKALTTLSGTSLFDLGEKWGKPASEELNLKNLLSNIALLDTKSMFSGRFTNLNDQQMQNIFVNTPLNNEQLRALANRMYAVAQANKNYNLDIVRYARNKDAIASIENKYAAGGYGPTNIIDTINEVAPGLAQQLNAANTAATPANPTNPPADSPEEVSIQ